MIFSFFVAANLVTLGLVVLGRTIHPAFTWSAAINEGMAFAILIASLLEAR